MRLAGYLAAIALIGSAPLAARAAEPPVCHGNDLIAQLMSADRPAFDAIEAEAARLANGNAKFWRIERSGHPHSFLLGTIASTDPRVVELARSVRTAVAEAKFVLTDVPDGDYNTYERVLTELGDEAFFPRGDNMLMRLDYPDYVELRAHLLKTGGSLDYIKDFKPWTFLHDVSHPICERLRGDAGLLTLEETIARMSEDDGKDVTDVETMEERLRREAAQPIELQLAELTLRIRSLDALDDWQETTVDAYLGNRLSHFITFSSWFARNDPIASAVHRYRRDTQHEMTKRMRDRALPLLEKGGAFIAVGALHLPGDKGLVALLREAGYTVTAVE